MSLSAAVWIRHKRTLVSIASILGLSLLLLGASGMAQKNGSRPLTAKQIAEKSFKSVAVLVTQDSKGQPISLGSGFFVRQDLVVTNYHVVKDAKKIFLRLLPQKDFCQASLVGIVEDEDLALLLVEGIKGWPLPLAVAQKVSVGDVVYVIGNPEGFEGTFSQGIVSGLRGDIYFQISAPISHGSSGGPVLDERGAVIGIASLMSSEGQNLNFAVHVSNVPSMIKYDEDMIYAARGGRSRCGISLAASTRGVEQRQANPLAEGSSGWRLIATSNVYNYYQTFDKVPRTQAGTTFRWTKLVPRLDTTEGLNDRQLQMSFLNSVGVRTSDRFSHILRLQEFSCAAQSARLVKFSLYDGSDNVLWDSPSYSSADWISVKRNTPADALLSAACWVDAQR